MADKKRPSEQQPPPGTMGPYKNKDQYPYDPSSQRFLTGLQDEAMDAKAGFPPKPLKPGEQYARGGIVGPNVQKWGSPKVSAPCADSKTIKCL